jgi:hypothetical protein
MSAGFARQHLSIDRQPQPIHSVGPDLRLCNALVMRWSSGSPTTADSAPIASIRSPIRGAKTMKAIRRSNRIHEARLSLDLKLT